MQECCIEQEGSRDTEPLDSENRWGIGPEKEGLGRVFCLAFFFFKLFAIFTFVPDCFAVIFFRCFR